jgi:signal transduction histidine kinase
MQAADEGRVILVTPTGRDAALVCALLGEAGINAASSANVPAALQLASEAVGAIVVADEALDRAAIAQLGRFREAQPAWSDVPVIILTRRTTPEVPEQSLAGLGQVSIIERPVRRRPFLSVIQSALRARARQYEAREQLVALRRVGDELRIANSMKDELLGLVSHELRTPLTGILGCASILLRRYEELPREDRRTLLRDIDDHAVRLQRIIENMLTLSRAEAKAEANTEPILLQRTVPPMLDAMKPLRGARSLHVSVAPALPPVMANAVFLEQVVSNLVRNSEKYAAPGEPVEVSLDEVDGMVAITVADRGAQLTARQVEQMFEVFYRDPEQELRTPGLGLGLPVCKRLTEVQGGTISAKPRAGGGLQVTVLLPIAVE